MAEIFYRQISDVNTFCNRLEMKEEKIVPSVLKHPKNALFSEFEDVKNFAVAI